MKYVIDGANVCYWRSPVSLAPLLTLLFALCERGDSFYCIFDARFRHSLDETDAKIYEQLRAYQNHFNQVPAGPVHEADQYVLLYANRHDLPIITKDLYRDYRDQYGWLNSPGNRLVAGNVMTRHLYVTPLSIEIAIDSDTVALWRRLEHHLTSRPVSESTPPQLSVSGPMPSATRCPTCDRENRVAARACAYCGALFVCLACGSAVRSSGQRFCTACGHALGQSPRG